MDLAKLFGKSYQDLSPDRLRVFLAEHEPGRFTLLDVRQPSEYEQGRIPGSTLIPLPELSGRSGELDPAKPVVAY